MKRLWTPWRKDYIENHGKQDGCVFCRAQSMADGPENLIVLRGLRAYVILNRFPYTRGHLMAVPFEHKSTLQDLDAATRAELIELGTRCMAVLKKTYNAQAFNLGANIGEAAGAGVKEHVHLHVVPRWVGDTNFMTTLGGTRVLPELLEDTYRRIHEAFQN